MDNLEPRAIVRELNKYIIGQGKAKKAVAIALRNRWRRQNVPEELREEILPNNIILIGPTGVGKTEISRRLANLVNAPFIKIEATKFTEVGYVGKEVGSIIRELVNIALSQIKIEMMHNVEDRAREQAKERVLDLLLPPIERKLKKIPMRKNGKSKRKNSKLQRKKTREPEKN